MDHWRPEVVYPNQFAYTSNSGIVSELRLSSHLWGVYPTLFECERVICHWLLQGLMDMNGDQLIKELVNKLSALSGISIKPSTISKMGKVYLLGGRLNGHVYLKAIARYPHRWGITKNTIDKIEAANRPWCILLLHDSEDTGYVISSPEYRERVAMKLWPFHQGDYKITEGKSLRGIPHFSFIDQLLVLLDSQLTEPSQIESLLESAKKKADNLQRKPTGESEQHKLLKEYIHQNPSLLGVDGVQFSYMEYLFPSGDRADVAFESLNNRWTVVEVEIEGLDETTVGIFQAVKYKSLQEALLKVKKITGQVNGVLVAKSISPQVRALAELLSIGTFEVSNQQTRGRPLTRDKLNR